MDKTNKSASELPRIGYAREPQVLRVIPWGRSTLWSKAKAGEFPKPVKLSARVTAWKCEDVWAWIERQGKAA
jgi:prophage regulatory protein